jgi:hypothetical protein
LVNADDQEYTEVQAEGADKVPASEKEKTNEDDDDDDGRWKKMERGMEMRRTMVMMTTRWWM